MFHHIGMLTLLPTASAAEADAIVEGLSELRGAVPGLQSAVVSRDAGLSDGNADIMFRMTFDTAQSWNAYKTHPAHVAVIRDRIAPVLASKTFVQVQDPVAS